MPRGLEEEDDDDRELYTIPSSSSWFDWDEIHETERRSLPEFFDGSSAARNPRIYKEYRDFIISKYREDPSRQLTFTEVRKSLIGGVGVLRKVFLCLERWGLINFGASEVAEKVEGRGPGGPSVVVEEGAPPGVQVVPASAPTGSATAASAAGPGGENGLKLPPLTSYTDVFGEWTPGRGLVCGVCGEQCVSGGYESTKGNFVTCPKCFEKNNNREAKSADDSKSNDQIDGNGDLVNTAWTDTETLLLLEGVLKHGDDWDLIAQHVRTKRKIDCIARLIQLPFGEHILNAISGKCDNKNSSSETTDSKTVQHVFSEPLQQPTKADGQHENNLDEKSLEEAAPERPSKRSHLLSFTDATDSLMRQVALLSTVAGPHVASTAVDAAVTALCNESPFARKIFKIDGEIINKFESSVFNNNLESGYTVEDVDLGMPKQTDMDMLESVPEKNFAAMAFQIRAATATALGAAAARAKLLADQEDREIEHLMATIIETQLRKMKYKIKHFEELMSIMEKEYNIIQQLKDSILEDWFHVIQQILEAGIPRWRDMDFPKSLLLAIL